MKKFNIKEVIPFESLTEEELLCVRGGIKITGSVGNNCSCGNGQSGPVKGQKPKSFM